MNVGERLKQRREALGLREIDVVIRMDAAGHTVRDLDVRRWERGDNQPCLDALVALSRALDVSTDWLLKGDS